MRITRESRRVRHLFYFGKTGLKCLSSLDFQGYFTCGRVGCLSVLGRNEAEIKVRYFINVSQLWLHIRKTWKAFENSIADQLPHFHPLQLKTNLGHLPGDSSVKSVLDYLLFYQSSGATQSVVHVPMPILCQLLVHGENSTKTESV